MSFVFPPGAPPAREVDVVDLRDATPDLRLATATLQGHVNDGPASRLYLVVGPWERFWLEELLHKRYIERSGELAPEACFEKYRGAFRKVIAYDPAVPASVNVATMQASLEEAIVAGPEEAARLAAGKPVEDLVGRWSSNVEAYRWAFRELWPRMNHRILACYQPTGLPHSMRDYFVRNKVFHCWVTAEEEADGVVSDYKRERAFLEELLRAAPDNVPVLGFWYSGVDSGLDEYRGVGLAGEYGKFTIPCDFASNLTLLSGVSVDCSAIVEGYRRRVRRDPPVLDPDKVYLCFDVVESGDAPSYLQNRQYEVWADPERGRTPINWAMAPGAWELEPSVAAYYFEKATPNDYLYVSLSGAGYCHPYRDFMGRTHRPEHAWKEYLRLTRRGLRRMGCNEIGLYTDAWRPFDRKRQDAVTLRFIRKIPEVTMLVLGMGRDDGITALNGNYSLGDRGAVVSHVLTRWPPDYARRSREENIGWRVEDIQANTPEERPAFVHAMALSWAYGPGEIFEVRNRLGDGYVPLTLPEFTALFRMAQGKATPGELHPGRGCRTLTDVPGRETAVGRIFGSRVSE